MNAGLFQQIDSIVRKETEKMSRSKTRAMRTARRAVVGRRVAGPTGTRCGAEAVPTRAAPSFLASSHSNTTTICASGC